MLSILANRALERDGLGPIRDKVLAGERLTDADGLRLFEAADLPALGALANHVREARHGALAFYNRNVHLNPTNVCVASCKFCSFARKDDQRASDGYTMSIDEAVGKVLSRKPLGVTEVHIVSGLHPDLPFEYYTELLSRIRAGWPEVAIKAFTAIEIHFFAEKFGMSYEQVLRRLMDAGLQTMPGGGAEIFAPRVRRKICDDKATADQWIEIHRTAHRLGVKTNSTMLYGHIERLDERVDHMRRLRELQDETHGFQVFIPLAFHPEHNMIGKAFPKPTGYDALRTLAVARLYLDNFDHVKAYWVSLGERLAQTALSFGVDDLDGTVLEERIYHMAGSTVPQALSERTLHQLIRAAGRVPAERDSLYRVLKVHDAPLPEEPPARLQVTA
ncbi:Radical SAM domain protein [Anaeromyxobacter dehalogenans 2CP-1]|uniref:Aminodeoxyfutalosine synthase n=1 Tax=Anaeromyxobacter dehalogenans (strain ATCC BAA-258 / DSM 21875 / 2CP-1) TaxID=455488 RepID=B8JAU7_ANAD2|nr:aminofutalosine synthase MqnE [Anaeromyxobacter dehalogenans]ACL63758.1 Radical SAM domain protein [Anaeromyxobacter dehalogenans 2CP-1]